MSLPAIDRSVEEARGRLSRAKAVEPAALFLMGTGAGLLPGRLEGGGRLPLDQLPGVPAPWREGLLHWGTFNGLPSWILEDATDSPDFASEPWERAFPCWLAAAAGAATLVHTCAGSALPAADGEAGETLPVGTLALVSDHINLSGGSPLQGLGASNLGPMFPDLSGLHEAALRHIALAVGERLGLPCPEAVPPSTLGPTLAARSGAAVLVGFIRRQGRRRHFITISRQGSRPEDATLATGEITAQVERAIRDAPTQWVWSLDRWRDSEDRRPGTHQCQCQKSANCIPASSD